LITQLSLWFNSSVPVCKPEISVANSGESKGFVKMWPKDSKCSFYLNNILCQQLSTFISYWKHKITFLGSKIGLFLQILVSHSMPGKPLLRLQIKSTKWS